MKYLKKTRFPCVIQIFTLSLQPKGCETANARPLDLWSLATEGTQELMQVSLLSLRSALPLG